MSWVGKLLAAIAIVAVLASISIVHAVPSGGSYPPEFTKKSGEWFDSWGYNRNYYGGSDGFLPNVAYESLGVDKELAYSIGASFVTRYPMMNERAEAILQYVQRWTEYGYDEENVFMQGIAQEEWAWNADETAHMFNEATYQEAVGDCEDMSFLCATLYLAAGFEVTLVSPPSHVALMIWLPEYDNANYYWDIPDDGKGKGWIWVEATGEENPLGWTPPDFTDQNWEIYQLGYSKFNVEVNPTYPQANQTVTIKANIVSARGDVEQVKLTYSIENFADYTTQMTRSGSTYQATIPSQPDNTKVTGTVSAIDSEGFNRNYDFEYTVGRTEGGGSGLPDFDFEIPDYLIEVVVVFLIIVVFGALTSRSR